jgi:tetratricopeptide (TPR) repeat protein
MPSAIFTQSFGFMLDPQNRNPGDLPKLGQHELGDPIGAPTPLEAAATVGPEHAATKLELVRELRVLDQLDQAEAVLGELLASEPRHIGALVEHGYLRQKRGDHGGAADAFEAASAVDPELIGVKLEVVRELRMLDRLDQAATLIETVLVIEPRHFGALVERGHVHRRRGDHARAAEAFEAASTIQPEHVGVRLELARDLRALNRLDQAEVIVETVLAAEPRQLGALIERGHLRRKRGNQAGAADAFETASAVEPQHVGVKLEFVRDLRALGRLVFRHKHVNPKSLRV